MREDRRDIRCAVCATTEGPFERHHIALRANHDTATVTLCRSCHDEQTDRQRRAGLITRKPIEGGDELRTLRALTEGLAGLLAANSSVLGDRQLAVRGDHDRRSTLRLLGPISDARPGQLGPSPIANDRRTQRRGNPSSRSREAPNPAVALQAVAPVLPALADAIDELLPDEAKSALVREFTLALKSIGRRLAADRERCAALAALDDHRALKS